MHIYIKLVLTACIAVGYNQIYSRYEFCLCAVIGIQCSALTLSSLSLSLFLFLSLAFPVQQFPPF
jgi:hypothetical protein